MDKRLCSNCVYWENNACQKKKFAKPDIPACADYIEDVKSYLKRQQKKGATK